MFRALGTLVTQYNKLFGSGGTKAIRQQLGLSDYNSKVKTTKALEKAASKLSSIEKKAKIAAEEIPLRDLSTTQDVQNTVDTANQVETSLQNSLTDWDLELPDVANTHTQTEGLTFRELQGLDKALQRTRGELSNNLAKLTDLDKDIAKERKKLDEAEDEISKTDIKARLKT